MLHNAIDRRVDYMQSPSITLCCKESTGKLFHKLGLLIKNGEKDVIPILFTKFDGTFCDQIH
jgi:hypothetical protein